jgi:hypothetical protein
MVQISLEELVQQVDAAAPQGSPLRKLSLAVIGSRELTEVADDLVGHYVEEARAAGASWSDIGAAMGVSKQAAQQRAQVRAEESERDDDLGEYAPEVAAAVRSARERAMAHRHWYVGTEHLLVGLLDAQDGRLADAVGLTADEAMDAALEIVGEGTAEVVRPPALTARATKVMQIAEREARHSGDDEVQPAHVLLALVREGRGVAAQVLDEHAGGLTRVRDAATSFLTTDKKKRKR